MPLPVQNSPVDNNPLSVAKLVRDTYEAGFSRWICWRQDLGTGHMLLVVPCVSDIFNFCLRDGWKDIDLFKPVLLGKSLDFFGGVAVGLRGT